MRLYISYFITSIYWSISEIGCNYFPKVQCATTFYQKYNTILIHIDDRRGSSQCGEFRKMREEKTKLMYLPTKKNMETWQVFSNDSSFRLQSAQKSKTNKDADTGRGLSVNLLWIDEAGGVDLEKIESSVFPTTSTTFMFCKENNIPHIILLSGTANGRVGIHQSTGA